ncbi:uncharacterized protein shn isoform X2 [Ochlerotatus camptorhynchus]|uniref:uncharacterized protein shn isoform X2 n=1 Tax=Ochlerotatus camptorhynchus TaxID=644619 RepID=UPI0031D40468
MTCTVCNDPGGGLPPAMEKSNSCSESKTTSVSQSNSTNSTAENSSQHHQHHHQQQHRHPPASQQQQPTATSSVSSSTAAAAAASTNSSDLKYLHKKFKRIASATLSNDDSGSESKKSVTSEAKTVVASAIGGTGAVVVVAACLPNLTTPAVVNSVEPSAQQQQVCANNNNNNNNQKKESDLVSSYESSAVRFRPEHSRTVIDGENYDSRLQLTFSSGSERLQLQQQQQQQHSNGASLNSANHISGSSSFIISNNRIPVRKEESEDSKPYYPSVNNNSAFSNSIYFNENNQCTTTGDDDLSPESLVALQAELENLSRGKVTVVGHLNFIEGPDLTVPSPYDPSSNNNNNNSTSVHSPHTPTVVSSSSNSSAAAASVSSSSTVPGRYVCPYCQLNCNKPSVLQKHIRRHTNERPFRCDPCGIAFKTKSNLYKHCRSRAHASKSQGDDIGPTLDEDGSLGSDIEDKELSNSGSDIINRGSPMDDRVHSPQLLVEKPYKPKFHNAALYTKFDGKLASGRYTSTTVANNSLHLHHHPQHHIGSGNATMTIVSQSAPAASHYLNGQNVESLEQHISKLISDNEAIVEVVELPLQKKYHKITGITRGISVNSTAPAAGQDSASSKLANALLQKRNSEELQQQQLLMLQQQQQQQQQQQMQLQPYPPSEPTKPKAMVAQIPFVQNHHPGAVVMQQPQQQQLPQPQMIVRPVSANEQQQEQLQQPLQQVQYLQPLNLSKPVPSEPAAASETQVATEPPRKRSPSEAAPFSREQSPSSSSSSVQQPAPITFPQQQAGPPSQPATPSQQSVTVTDHPQNPERSIIKDLLLNSRGFGVVQNPENENIENLFTCKSCNTSFRDAEILKYHTICYCRGNGDPDSAPHSPVGSPSSHFMRSRSASDRFNPTSLKNLARGLLNPPSRNPSSLSKLAKSQLRLPRSRPENIALPSKENCSSSSPSSSTATSSTPEVLVTPILARIVDVVQNPLPSPGPLLGNTRLVDFQSSKSESYGGKAASESNVVVSHVPNEETSLRRRPMDSHPAELRRLQHPNYQMYGGEMEILERHQHMPPHRYSSGGTVTRFSPDVDIEMHDSGMGIRTSMHSGGTIHQLPKTNQSMSPIPMNPDTPKLILTITPTPTLTAPNFFPNQRQAPSEGNITSSSASNAQPITHFHFPPINPITAYNPLTLPQVSPGQASQIMHGGKLIPFVQGIPGPNSMMTPNETQSRGRPRMAPSPISIKTPQPSPQFLPVYKPMTSFDPDDVTRHKKPVLAVPPVKNGMFKEIWSPAKQEYNPVPKKSFNFTRIADNISPRKKELVEPVKKEEIRYFNFENLISKSEILIKSNTPVESVKPDPIETKPLDVQPPPPMALKPKFLRPNSLPLKPGTWTPKRHHGITPTQNTMPLISPETPRPSKSCRELYFNGHAYTNIGLKSSTKPFYCTVNKTQPFYVQTQKQLSMYSNWQVHPENDPHPLGFKPIQVMALYDSSQQRDHRYSIATKPLALTVSSSSPANQSIMSAVEVKTNFPSYPITQLSSPAPKPGAFYVYQPEKCAASNDSMPPRSESSERTLSGGFESNEEYTYVRGRGRGKYVCKECGIRCKKPSMLKKHIRTHTDVRPYSCQHCSFHFKTKGNLTKHMKSKSHFKKCTELGLNPIPTSVDDDGADIDIENDQQSISSERTSTIPGDSDSGSESDGEESDDSDESKSRLPEHEAAHCLLSLSMTPPTGSQVSKSYPSPVPFGGSHHLERTGRLPYGPNISPGLVIPSQQQQQQQSQLPLPQQLPLPPQLTQKQLLLQTAQVDTTSQPPRRVISFGNTPKVEFNLLKHEQYYSDPNISRKKREYNPSYDDDDGVMPIDLTKKAREPPPPDAALYRIYHQFPGQQSPSGVPIQPQSEYPSPNRSQVIVRVSDVVTPITGAANLLTTLVSNTDKIPLTNALISNGGKELADDNVFFQEYIKQRALRDSKMKLSQMKSINNNQYEAEEPRPPPPVEVISNSTKPVDSIPSKPMPPKVNDKPYRIFNGKNELLPKAVVGEPANRIEILPIVSEPIGIQLDPVGPKEVLVAESPVAAVALPAVAEPPNTSRMETLAEVAAGSLKLDAAAGTSADPMRSRSNSLKLSEPVALKQSTTSTAPVVASSKESAKSVASEYLKLTKSVTMRKREDSESGTASDQESLVENKMIPTPIVAPIVPPVLVVPSTANPATGELGGIKARTVVVGEDGFKTNPSNEFSSLSPFQEDGGRPVCEVCHKKFHKISQLKIHMNIHYMERKFRCEPCGTSFRSQGLFQKHERSATHRNKVSMTTTFGIATDSNPRPFYCKDCDVGFRIHGHLAKHLRSKMHVLKLECLGKLPFGTYTEIERSGTNLTEIDTTDCANSLSSLKRLAVRLNVKDPANVLPGGPGSDAPPSGNETDSCDENPYENDNESNGEGDSPGSNGPNHRGAGTEEDDDDGEDGEISGGDQAPQGNNNNLKRKPDDSGTTMTNCDGGVEIKRARFHGPPPVVMELRGLQTLQHQQGSVVTTSGSATGET